MQIIEDHGYDANQNEIIDALKVNKNIEGENPGDFTNNRIRVNITNHDAREKGSINLQIKVQTQYAKVGPNFTFSIIPIVIPDHMKKNMKMVLRWDMGVTLALRGHDIYGPHAILANDYDSDTGNYHCVNDWIDKNLPINNSRIYAVDYVRIIEI